MSHLIKIYAVCKSAISSPVLEELKSFYIFNTRVLKISFVLFLNFLDSNSAVAAGLWLLVDKIIQQVVLQKNGQDYDAATLEINVKKTIQM